MSGDARSVTLPEIQAAWPAISAASTTFLRNFGPGFAGGHIATDIAGAAAIAGRLLLEASGTPLEAHEPGQVLLWESHEWEEAVIRFLRAAGTLSGLSPEWTTARTPAGDQVPRLDTNAMTARLREPLRIACDNEGLAARFHPFVAGYTAVRLIAAGVELKLLPEDVGKTTAMVAVLEGARTIPPRATD